MRSMPRLAALAVISLLAMPLIAATYVVPPDAEMIQRSDDIVIATAAASTVERSAQGGIVTRYTLQIEEVLKGDRRIGQALTLTERGGRLGEASQVVFGSPVYVAGHRYLVFTSANRAGDPTTFGLQLGQFAFEQDGDEARVLRAPLSGFDQNGGRFVERARDAERFLEYIRDVVAGRYASPSYFVYGGPIESKVGVVEQAFTRASYLVLSDARWQSPVASFVVNGSAAGLDSSGAISNGMAQWNGVGVGINYTTGGQDPTATGGTNSSDNKNSILFNDPNNEIDDGTALGLASAWFSSNSYTVGGETFLPIIEVDVTIEKQSGWTPGTYAQVCLNSVMTHELGHTLGFRHSDQNKAFSGPCPAGFDCTTDAIMVAVIPCQQFNGAIHAWDVRAAETVYGNGPAPCTPPQITGQPQSTSVAEGQQATLSVTATGTAPLSYVWYQGATGNTASPVGTGQTLNVVPPASGTTYWVRVTGQCAPPADSTAATVTVTCGAPQITSGPSSVSISEGESAALSVSATGSSLTYQWFQGTPPTGTPVGTNSPTLIVSPATTTSYFVRVSGACGSPVNSNAATVTVTACPAPSEVVATATRQPNNSFVLSVSLNGFGRTLFYAWFQGATPGVGGTQIGSTAQLTVPAPSVATPYWVRIRNDCGREVFSNVVFADPCGLASITTEPQDQTIANGASATLSIVFTSSSTGTVTWYRGNVGDKSNPVGTGNSVTVGPLTTTTKFWASITNACGERSSRSVTINVSAVCNKPVITVAPQAQTKHSGETVTLSVTATGNAPLHYQWFAGGTPVGTDAPTFTSSALTATTTFSVKVTNSCGEATASAIVTVVKPKVRSVRH